MKHRTFREAKYWVSDDHEWPVPVEIPGTLPVNMTLGYAAPIPGETIAVFATAWKHVTEGDGSERLWLSVNGMLTEVQRDSPEWLIWKATREAEAEEEQKHCPHCGKLLEGE